MSPSTPTPSPSAGPTVGTHAIRPLSLTEARVLSTLMEKARTVPDTYPMTLNGLFSGCNQKTSREPVMNLSEAEVLEALDGLRDLHLISESSGGRAARFGHQFQRAYGVPEQSAVLLGLLMLRGPQTAGELRLNAERWYRFADISSVEGFLDELQERSQAKGGALVLKLPRAPGAREQRWAHLLCGPVDEESLVQGGAMAGAQGGGLAQRVLTLETEVTHLRAALVRVCAELGMPAPEQTADKPSE